MLLSRRERTSQRGATEAHLNWGRNPYKFKLLGVPRDMANLDVYRSRIQYYRSFNRVLRNVLDDFVEKKKRTLLESEQRSGFRPSLTGRIVKIMRKIKRAHFRPTS